MAFIDFEGNSASTANMAYGGYWGDYPSTSNTTDIYGAVSKRMRISYTGSGTTTMIRSRGVSDPNPYRQRTVSKDRYGKRLRTIDEIKARLKGLAWEYIDRWNNATLSTLPYGAMFLDYVPDAATTPSQYYYPAYVFDLTSFPNYMFPPTNAAAPTTPGTYCPIVARRLSRLVNDSIVYPYVKAGDYATQVQISKNREDAANVVTWQTERRDQLAPSFNCESVFLEWVDIRMIMYGATQNPTWVQVQLVSFDEEYCPSMQLVTGVDADAAEASTAALNFEDEPGRNFGPSVAGQVTVEPHIERWNNMWNEATDRLVGNPITKRGQSRTPSRMRVLYSKVFEFQPTQSTESDATPHEHQFHLFWNAQRVIDLTNNAYGQADVDVTEVANPNEWERYIFGAKTVSPKHPQRVYLLVKGHTPKAAGFADAATTKNAFAPSFDLIIRRKRSAY